MTNHGYGVISRDIVYSLQSLGHSVPFRDPTAQVELNIGQPYHWMWMNRASYKIGLVAWESTQIPPNWHQGLRTADEIWTPSPVVAGWFAEQGYDAKVYEHGVDSTLWTPRRRKPKSRIRFLHIGEPAPRKGGQLVYDAFKEVFGNTEHTLTIKAHSMSRIRGKNNAHPFKECKNVNLITDELPEEELVGLVQSHDVLVYPSYGEGFGLIPLQAMATGMPVICTEAWAPYKSLLVPELRLRSQLGNSLWPVMHPGEVFFPDLAHLRELLAYTVDNFEILSKKSFGLVPHIQRRYSWDRQTKKAFDPICEKFES